MSRIEQKKRPSEHSAFLPTLDPSNPRFNPASPSFASEVGQFAALTADAAARRPYQSRSCPPRASLAALLRPNKDKSLAPKRTVDIIPTPLQPWDEAVTSGQNAGVAQW